MTATWYLVQYIPDVRRREPRNIGVALRTPTGWLTRFFAEQSDGSINGHKLRGKGIDTEVYKTWVSYYRRKADRNKWEDVDDLQATRRGNYVAQIGGHLLIDPASWATTLDQLYAELVETPEELTPPKTKSEDHFDAAIEQLLSSAGIQADRHVKVNGKWLDDGPTVQVPFSYSFVNGQPHLMDRIYWHVKPDKAEADARELRARIDAVKRAGTAKSFVSFYASGTLPNLDLEGLLSPLDRISYTVDVDQPNQAMETLKYIKRHEQH